MKEPPLRSLRSLRASLALRGGLRPPRPALLGLLRRPAVLAKSPPLGEGQALPPRLRRGSPLPLASRKRKPRPRDAVSAA